ncbi:unnamed protein product, partial [Allacma fusca]
MSGEKHTIEVLFKQISEIFTTMFQRKAFLHCKPVSRSPSIRTKLSPQLSKQLVKFPKHE